MTFLKHGVSNFSLEIGSFVGYFLL